MSALEEKKARRAADREARRQAAETADGTAEAPEVRDTPPPLAALRAHLASTLPSPAQAEVKDDAAAFMTENPQDAGETVAADETSLVAAPTDAETRAAKAREDASEARYYKAVGQHLAASRDAIGELEGIEARGSRVQEMLEQAERALREADAVTAMDDDDHDA